MTGPKVGKRPNSMDLLIVAAALQRDLGLRSQLVWAAPGTPVVDALVAALAFPGLFPPVSLRQPEAVEQWISKDRVSKLPARLDLIDGAVVRQNPMPALFSWLSTHEGVARELAGEGEHDAGIHVVYNVPIEPYKANGTQPSPERIDVVSAAFASIELARRRDTKMEYRLLNFVSELELWIEKVETTQAKTMMAQAGASNASAVTTQASPPVSAGAALGSPPLAPPALKFFPIFADEIAPETDIHLSNSLSPDRQEILEIAASGCRRTLQTLYRQRLLAMKNGKDHVPCASLLRQVAADRTTFITDKVPGLEEVCRHCSRILIPRLLDPQLPPPVPAERFPNLSGERSRVVFLASGGVFRGAFHIGVIGAMRAAHIRPDLIVGASVGALMGGSLGAISTAENDSANLLAELCLTFLHVDKRIALTRTLKSAAKQLGVRTRKVDLSPAELRRVIRRGTRKDAGYAVSGAPPALIDAISTIFLIPHEDTQRIAAEFVAGHISKAMHLFWSKVRTETLQRLDIENALMGTSLLEDAARKLMGQGRGQISFDTEQPYHRGSDTSRWISFFCTTSDLNQRRSLLLGRDLPCTGSYDFVKACLSSSAFPAIFSPRQEAEVLPGRGKTNVLFADGGMFDNLPFFPAIEVLSSVQSQMRPRLNETACQSLQRRSSEPDLFIAAALETETAPPGDAEDLMEIQRRAGTFRVNVKLNTFNRSSDFIAAQTQRLLAAAHGKVLPAGLPEFMDRMVPAAVLKVAPTDREHLNPTYAFCSATGMESKKVALSIADGCFQALGALVAAQSSGPSLLRTSMDRLTGSRIGKINKNPKPSKEDGHTCPFYLLDDRPFECKFAEAAAAHLRKNGASTTVEVRKVKEAAHEVHRIFKVCVGDPKHRHEKGEGQ